MVICDRTTVSAARRARLSLRRAALLAASSLAALAAAGAANAAAPTRPAALPVRQSVDANGVDLISGQMSYSDTMLSIGAPGAGGLSLTFNGDLKFTPGGSVSVSGAQYTVSYGAQTWTFTQSGGAFTNNVGDGATFSSSGANTYQLVTRDGTTVQYNQPYPTTSPTSVVMSATQPDGGVTTFTYKPYTISASYTDIRLQAVTNNHGYMLKFGYASVSDIGARYPNSVTAINNAVDYCDPMADACSGLTVSWPSVSISETSSSTVTGPVSQVVYPAYVADPSMTRSGSVTYKRPSGMVETITYASGRVSSVSTPAGTWTYAYQQSGADLITTVTDPLNHTRVVRSSGQNGTVAPYVESDTDGAGHTTTYGHNDPYGRLTSVTSANNVTASYTLDARGNTTQTVYTPNPNATTSPTLSPITITTNYDASCSSPAKCNQPNYVQQTVNGATEQTTYVYNATTGQVTSVTGSVGANTIAPQTRYNYSSLQALAKNSAGALVAAGPAISVPEGTSACATTAWSGSACGSHRLRLQHERLAQPPAGVGDAGEQRPVGDDAADLDQPGRHGDGG